MVPFAFRVDGAGVDAKVGRGKPPPVILSEVVPSGGSGRTFRELARVFEALPGLAQGYDRD